MKVRKLGYWRLAGTLSGMNRDPPSLHTPEVIHALRARLCRADRPRASLTLYSCSGNDQPYCRNIDHWTVQALCCCVMSVRGQFWRGPWRLTRPQRHRPWPQSVEPW
eukprot:3739191-Prymnesium_polylepis.2